LAGQRAGGVGQVILGADRLHPLGDLGGAVAGQIRVKMVFNLITEVSTHERHHRPGAKVGTTQHLSQIPLRIGLTLEGLGGEFLGSVGEVAAADHRVGP
jgi:hypothetical protein